MVDAEDRGTGRQFEQLAARFLADPMVSEGTGFGSSRGLRVEGRIFAIFGKGDLTLKLPSARVDELIALGIGTRFDPGHGRLMKQWVTVSARHVIDWEKLADEALRFVRSLG